MKHTLCVYGSLRLGAINNRLMEGADYVGTTQLPGFTLYELGGWFPGIKQADESAQITVDIYENVSEEHLRRLDRYEGFHEESPANSLFRRCEINLNKRLSGNSPESWNAWIYVYNGAVDMGNAVESGDWLKVQADKSRN